MSLPVPTLDDRRFQDLVNDAKRLVQQRCPEWSDHNVHDPGVTLIELFAWMTDLLLYRLNRVPDRQYLKFLELIGVHLFPPTAAQVPITFWLTAPQGQPVVIPRGTEVATLRTEVEEAIGFTTTDELRIPACSALYLARSIAEQAPAMVSDSPDKPDGFYCFSPVPKAGDGLLIGLSDAVPGCVLRLRLRCQIEGVGVDPDNPPLAWEAWSGHEWTTCEVGLDQTGGLNRDGDVELHIPQTHVVSVLVSQRAGWLRARVVEPEQDVPSYSASPFIKELRAFSIGGTTDAINAVSVENEIVGTSEGTSGQTFPLKHRLIVPTEEAAVLEVSSDDGWQEWHSVTDFAASTPEDRHFVLDQVAGEVRLGPAVREANGGLHRFGAVPSKGAQMRVRLYRSGGGRNGNVAARTITVLKSSIPYVGRVENRRSAEGGVDGEDLENAKVRGPLLLRTRSRAVTAEDYEYLASEAAPEIARVRCVSAERTESGSVRVLVVPRAQRQGLRLRFEQLVPSQETLARITARLEECRVLGARVVVEPPLYRGITVVARLRPRSRTDPTRLQQAALEALYDYFDPIRGGPEKAGWPFGRMLQLGEVYAVLQSLAGTELIEDARLFPADPISGKRGEAIQRLDLEPHALIFSYEHQVVAEKV